MFIEKKRGPYFYHTNNFQTISISLLFPFDYDEKDFVKRNIINDVTNRSMNYKTKKEFKQAIIENYIVNFDSYHFSLGDTSYIKFDLVIPNPDVIKDVSLDKCFSFFADCIYNPFIEDGGLEKDEIKRQIEICKSNIEDRKNLIANYAQRRIYEIAAPNTKLSGSIEKYANQLDEINSKNLYEFYKKNIINNTPFVFVMGDVDEDVINSLCNKYLFKNNKETISISERLNYFLKPSKFESICEEKEFFQSYISLIYKVKNMEEKDRIVLSAINMILNSQASNLLNDKLRNENDLVYTSGADCKTSYGLLSLNALIHRESKDKAISIMKDVINLLKDKEYILPLLENIKNKERIEMIKDKDRKNIILSQYFIDSILEFSISPEEFYNKLCAVSTDDIKDVAERLCLCNEYFVRGMKDAR